MCWILAIFTGWLSDVCWVSPSIFSFPPEQSERLPPWPRLISVTSLRSEASPAVRPRPTSLQSWLGLTNSEAGSGEQSTNAGRDLDNLGQTRWEVVGPGAPSTHQHRERDFKTTFLVHYIYKEVSTKWCCTEFFRTSLGFLYLKADSH